MDTRMLKHKLFRTARLLINGKFFEEARSRASHQHEEKILPVIDIGDIAGSISDSVVFEKDGVDGNITFEELKTMAKLAAAYKPKTVFEIGTFDGRTTLNIAANIAEDSHIFTLDLPRNKIYSTDLRIKSGDMKFIDKKIPGVRFIGSQYDKMITQLYGDSATFDFTPYENLIDFIFIDGSHSYEYVVNDTVKCRKLLRNGKGIILWHDYGWHEVVKALNKFYRTEAFYVGMKQIRNTSLVLLNHL